MTLNVVGPDLGIVNDVGLGIVGTPCGIGDQAGAVRYRLVERTHDCEPSGRFGVDTADWQRTYVLTVTDANGNATPVPTQVLTDHMTIISGTTLPGPATGNVGQPGGRGSIARILPMCDPQFNSL